MRLWRLRQNRPTGLVGADGQYVRPAGQRPHARYRRRSKLLHCRARRQGPQFILQILTAVAQQNIHALPTPSAESTPEPAQLISGDIANHSGKQFFPVNIQLGQEGLELSGDRSVAANRQGITGDFVTRQCRANASGVPLIRTVGSPSYPLSTRTPLATACK